MTDQNHRGAQSRQASALHSGDDGLEVADAIGESLGGGGKPPALQPGAHGGLIAARMLHQHHDPAPRPQGCRQPFQLGGAASEAMGKQQPGGAWAGRVRLPQTQLQRQGAMGNREAQPLLRCGSGVEGSTLGAGQDHPIGEGQQWRALGQRQAPQRLESQALLLQLALPTGGQLQQAIEMERQPLAGQGPHQLEGRDLLLLLQQPADGAVEHRPGIALLGAEHATKGREQPLPSPALEQLPGHGAIPQQRRAQQPQQRLAAPWFEQIEPGSEITVRVLGIPAPGLKLAQIQGKQQTIQPDLQPFRSPQWQRPLHADQEAGEQAAQQTAEQVAA
jgi:hypothetical protein